MKTCKNCNYFKRQDICETCRRYYNDDDPNLKDKWKPRPKFKGMDFIYEVK